MIKVRHLSEQEIHTLIDISVKKAKKGYILTHLEQIRILNNELLRRKNNYNYERIIKQ